MVFASPDAAQTNELEPTTSPRTTLLKLHKYNTHNKDTVNTIKSASASFTSFFEFVC
jgi:hypothetical protein